MANDKKTTSVSISFTTSAETVGAILDAEVKDEDQPDGDTSFVFGDDAYYRVYTYNIDSYSVELSDPNGADHSSGSGTEEDITEVITWTYDKESSVQYPIKNDSIKSIEWLSKDQPSGYTVAGKTIKVSEEGLFVAKVTYDADYDLRYISGIQEPSVDLGDEGYPVIVYIVED